MKLFKPLFYTVCAGLSSTLMVTFVKIGLGRGETVPSIMFWRSWVALFFIVPMMTFLTKPRLVFWDKLKTQRIGLIIVRSIANFTGAFLFYYCAHLLSLTIASLLYFTIPLFMPLIGYIWKRQTIPWVNWFGIGLGFLGVVLVLKPGATVFHTSALIGLLGGFMATIGQFAVHLMAKTETTFRMNFYYYLFSLFIAFPMMLIQGDPFWNLTAFDCLNYFAIGFFNVAYLTLITLALKSGPPSLVTTFLYSAVLFAMLFDWMIWGYVIHILTLIGIVCVISGVVLKFYLHKRHTRSKGPGKDN